MLLLVNKPYAKFSNIIGKDGDNLLTGRESANRRVCYEVEDSVLY